MRLIVFLCLFCQALNAQVEVIKADNDTIYLKQVITNVIPVDTTMSKMVTDEKGNVFLDHKQLVQVPADLTVLEKQLKELDRSLETIIEQRKELRAIIEKVKSYD